MANYRHARPCEGAEEASARDPADLSGIARGDPDGATAPGGRAARAGQAVGASPVPVAEALVRLEIEGLVQSRPLCGSQVRSLSLEDVENETILREALECQAARVCAEKAIDAALGGLKTAARRLDRMMHEGDPHRRAHYAPGLPSGHCAGVALQEPG